MKHLRQVAWLSLLSLVACGPAKPDKTPQSTNSAAVGENPLTAPADYLGAVSQAQKTAVRTVDLTSVSKAIQMFQVSEGRWPRDLNELVTEQYLPKLPALPAGMRYAYDPNSGTVKAVTQ